MIDSAIVVLAKGYHSKEQYKMLIERNKLLEEFYNDKIDYLIFYNGNILEEHQNYIQAITIIPFKFINIANSTNNINDKNISKFWLYYFWNYVKKYNKILRIDEDCYYKSNYNIVFKILNQYTVCYSELNKFNNINNIEINNFVLEIFEKINNNSVNNIHIKSFISSGPYTNIIGFNLNHLRQNLLFTKFIKELINTDYIYRFDESILWGVILLYLFDKTQYCSLKLLKCFYKNTNYLVKILDIKGNYKIRRYQKIPYNIFQIFVGSKTVPLSLWYNTLQWTILNPEYDYYFFDDAKINNYIEHYSFKSFNFSKNKFKQAYNKIYPHAGKSDLFRLLIIYEKGGCYFDIDAKSITPLSQIIEPDDEVVSGIGKHKNFHQYGLIYIPYHPFIKKALELAVDNIITEKFINNIKKLSYLTGPPCLNLAIRNVLNKNINFEFSPGKYQINNIKYTLLDGDYFNNQIPARYKDYIKDLKTLKLKHWLEDKIFV